jgi:hypothetical protein
MEHITKFPRYCSVTGRGMYEGYVIDDGMYHASDVGSLLRVLSEHYGVEFSSDEDAVLDLLDDTYDKLWYWTEWEDSDIPEWDEDTEVQA